MLNTGDIKINIPDSFLEGENGLLGEEANGHTVLEYVRSRVKTKG